MFELVDMETGVIVERHEYDFSEFIEHKYSRFYSLLLGDRIILGDVYPELVWREVIDNPKNEQE